MKKWFVFIVLIVLLYFPIKKGSDAFRNYRELAGMKETFSGDSASLEKTVILPTFDSLIVPAKNNVWCSSFQLAWNEMKEKVIQEPIQVVGAAELARRLNNAKQKKTDLSQDSYYVAAGKVSDGIADTIQKDMARRFPLVKTPEFSSDDELIAYAYLETYIKFTKPFRDYEKALIFRDSNGNTTPVKSFGTWGGFQRKYKLLCEQIDVLYCKLNEEYGVVEFALDLCKDTEPYQIVVSCIEPKDSLEETFNSLQSKIESFRDNSDYDSLRKFGETDVLQVPDMFWKIIHHFSELENKSLENGGFQGLPITTAMQMVAFRLDRSGVILKSEAMMAAEAFPRMFVLDKPFLLYLKKRDTEQPFFVMWVDNVELLTPFED